MNRLINFILSFFAKGIDTYKAKTARFLTSSKQFNTTQVKGAAFLPMLNNNSSNFETSIYVINSLDDDYIKDIGKKVVKLSNRSLHGYAYLEAKYIVSAGLEVDFDNTPKHHANIIGWASNKSKRKLQAQKLSINAALRLYSH